MTAVLRRPRQGANRPAGKRRRWRRRVLFVVGACLLAVLIGAGIVFAITPSVGDAEVRVAALAAQHGAADNGAPVPALFAESIVASEDSRFYSDDGVDPIGLARAAWTTVTGGGDGGGSTISQQLAKLLYTNGQSSAADDVEQVALAIKLNLQYSKAQILEMYADTVYFGHGFYGLDGASCGYFGVRPGRLSLPQASLLAGLVQAPSAYDPLEHLRLARARQRYVLDRLVATGQISQRTAAAAYHAPLGLQHNSRHSCV
jgi:penicillin-binding protein 1A